MRLRVANSAFSLSLMTLGPLALAGCATNGPAVGDSSGLTAGGSAGTASAGGATSGTATGAGTPGVGTTTGGGTTNGTTTGAGAPGVGTTTGGGTTNGTTTGGGTPSAGAPNGMSGMSGMPAGGTTGLPIAGATMGGDGGTSAAGSGGAGGASASGGASTGVTGEWGLVEDPGAGCTVPALPGYDELTANAKLPDPFTKIDGTPITTKAEWKCRREEILQQLYTYVWGEKPVPPAGATTGMVSESSISVSVTDGDGSTSFSLEVDMNGATAPAPAIIYYDGGLGSPLPIPNGVASIRFVAGEVSGGSGDKSGDFYDVYGSDHPAGYLTAQAWQISRVLDVLEQDPSVIDPHHVGVTGCSRNGKGAFVGGALDNRIALTIPVESGIAGTVGLRLIEVLGGGEWPYHGISYVRWMSEVALGPFTNANSAGGDNTDRLPVDMHEMMALIAPRGLYIVDNPSTMYEGLDRQAAWVTGNVGKMAFEALGVGDHMSYEGASGTHCSWRGQQYDATLDAMIDKFLLGNDAAATGNVNTDLPNPPSASGHIDWTPPTLSGDL